MSTSLTLTSPLDRVSSNVACQIRSSARLWVVLSAVPAKVASIVADGAVSIASAPTAV